LVKLFLVESGLGRLGDLDVDRDGALCSLLPGDSGLLLFKEFFAVSDLRSGGRLGVHTDNLAR